MRIALCVALLLPFSVFAGNNDSLKNSVGVVIEAGHTTTLGLQFSHSGSHCLSWNASLEYGSYSDYPLTTLSRIKGDTASGRSIHTSIDLGLVGFGLQAQHRLYKRLYVFGGATLKAGYGAGTTDTVITRQYNVNITSPVSGVPEQGLEISTSAVSGPRATMFYLGFSPSLGIKLELRRFCIGTAIVNYATMTSLHTKGASPDTRTSFDFDSDHLTQRFFVTYRF